MSELMCDLEFVRAYIDDVAILSQGTWEDHVAKVEKVLTRLEDAGLKEFEYLGYVLTQDGVKPIQKKVKACLI